jgi:hypothetical protein
MALLLPDEVINTTGLFSDVHALITDLIRKGIPIFVPPAKQFFPLRSCLALITTRNLLSIYAKLTSNKK